MKGTSYKYVIVIAAGNGIELPRDVEERVALTAASEAKDVAFEGVYSLRRLLEAGWIPVRETPFAPSSPRKGGTDLFPATLVLLVKDERF